MSVQAITLTLPRNLGTEGSKVKGLIREAIEILPHSKKRILPKALDVDTLLVNGEKKALSTSMEFDTTGVYKKEKGIMMTDQCGSSYSSCSASYSPCTSNYDWCNMYTPYQGY